MYYIHWCKYIYIYAYTRRILYIIHIYAGFPPSHSSGQIINTPNVRLSNNDPRGPPAQADYLLLSDTPTRQSHRPTDQPLSLPTSTRSVSIRVMFHVRVDLYYNHYYRYQSFSWAFSRLIRRSHTRTARPPALTGRYQDDQNGTAPPVPSRPRITAATKRPD